MTPAQCYDETRTSGTDNHSLQLSPGKCSVTSATGLSFLTFLIIVPYPNNSNLCENLHNYKDRIFIEYSRPPLGIYFLNIFSYNRPTVPNTIFGIYEILV